MKTLQHLPATECQSPNPIIGLLLLSTKKNLILPFCSTTENDFLCAPSSYKMSEHILIRQILHHNFFVSLSQIVKWTNITWSPTLSAFILWSVLFSNFSLANDFGWVPGADPARSCRGKRARENYLVLLLNNAAVYMFPPHSERNTEKRVHLGQDKGAVLAKKRASTLSFHREEGGTAPICP